MQYFSADKIHDGHNWLKPSSVLVFDDNNIFIEAVEIDVIDPNLVQHFEGTLLPGMVNAHCHLELSHLKGSIPEDTGLVNFLTNVVQYRNVDVSTKNEAILKAAENLSRSGCIAVGDICNTTDLVEIRKNVPMHFLSFIETMGFVPQGAASRFTFSEQIYNRYTANANHNLGYSLTQSIVPHAPYSVSDKLFGMINNFGSQRIIAIHNEESAAENQYFFDKSGDMEKLYKNLKIDDRFFQASGKSSLQTYLPYFDKSQHLLLVHNTFITQSDIDFIKREGYNVSLCLCPNANWYIERTLPDIDLIAHSGLNICLGTDSLASNHSLDILSEIQKIQQHFSHISEASILSWATQGGAKALGLDNRIGSYKKGYKPGLVSISKNRGMRVL